MLSHPSLLYSLLPSALAHSPARRSPLPGSGWRRRACRGVPHGSTTRRRAHARAQQQRLRRHDPTAIRRRRCCRRRGAGGHICVASCSRCASAACARSRRSWVGAHTHGRAAHRGHVRCSPQNTCLAFIPVSPLLYSVHPGYGAMASTVGVYICAVPCLVCFMFHTTHALRTLSPSPIGARCRWCRVRWTHG